MQGDDNFHFEPMADFSSIVKEESKPIEEREYFSLYDELEEKCNPDRYMNPFVQEKFDLANELYAELQKRSKRDDKSLIDIRDKAIKGLGIHISTQRLYNYLMEYCHPKIYTAIEPYDKDNVQEAGRLFAMIQKAKDDIHALEAVEQEAEPFIERRKRLLLADKMEEERRKGIEKHRLEEEQKKQKGKTSLIMWVLSMICGISLLCVEDGIIAGIVIIVICIGSLIYHITKLPD